MKRICPLCDKNWIPYEDEVHPVCEHQGHDLIDYVNILKYELDYQKVLLAQIYKYIEKRYRYGGYRTCSKIKELFK